MFKIENRKGLSDVVATVLIILLALAAVVIVWSFVSPSLKNTGTQIDVQSKCLASEVKPTACVVANGVASGTIQLLRGEPNKVKLVITAVGNEKTPGEAVIAPAQTLGTVSDGVIVTSVLGGAPYKASAAAIFSIEGKDYVCPESTTVIAC